MCNRQFSNNGWEASRFHHINEKKVSGLIATHCVVHRQHLDARNLSAELHNPLDIVIKCINKIKAHSLNERLFRALCHDNENNFERLLLHTVVRWPLKGACMTSFYSLYDLVIQILTGIGCQLTEAVKPLKNDIACLADIFTFMNE